MKERFLIKKKLQRSCWVKKGKTETWWENFSNSKVPEFLCAQERFLWVTYAQNCTHICRRNKIVWEAQCQLRFQWWRCYRKTVNVFGISRASVSAIIKRISYAITIFSGPEPVKLPTTESKVKELTNIYWEHTDFLNAYRQYMTPILR